MATRQVQPSIDEYLRKRLMPVEGTIPHLPGIDMFGNSIPAGTVGGDLFEYINFQQRYDIDARIARALKLSKDYLEPLPKGPASAKFGGCSCASGWHRSRATARGLAAEYRRAKSSEQLRVAEDLQELYTTAGVLWWMRRATASSRRRLHRPFTTRFMPSCFLNSIERKNDTRLLREDQSQAGAVSHRTQRFGKESE